MNLKRGVTRLYVVLWVAWAGLGLTYAIQRTQEVWDKVHERRMLKHRVLSGKGGNAISEAALDSVIALRSPTDPYDDALLRSLSDPFPELAETPFNRLRVLNADRDVEDPARRTALVWGLWVLLTGVAPGVLLLVTRWVAVGFSGPRHETQ